MSNTTLEMAPSFEGLPERQGQSCGLDEPDLGTLMIEEFSISDTAKKAIEKAVSSSFCTLQFCRPSLVLKP